MAEHKALEARTRRAAGRLGWRLEKSRVRNVHANNHGLWQLIDDRNVVIGGADYEATLDDCAAWIEQESLQLAA